MSFNTKSTLKCPVCNTDIAVEKNEVHWCENCDWNVDPLASDRKENAFEKFVNSLGRKISEGIYTLFFKMGHQHIRMTEELFGRFKTQRVVPHDDEGAVQGTGI